MTTETVSDASEDPAGSHTSSKNFRMLVLGCLGVVYGDIGTSPLYAFREASHFAIKDGVLRAADIFGILSLIIWALIFVGTVKYVLIVLRLDNRGEGGILSLMALARRGGRGWRHFLLAAGLIGAGLFYGDAVITPAISVMSAIEGLKIVSPAFNHLVLPLTIFVLLTLFYVQKFGTDIMARFFGPITAVWFLVLGGVGIYWICKNPEVLHSFNPYYAGLFLYNHSGIGLAVLGAVFLAVTGAEALYADLGHFGRKPIVFAWLYMVFPCLVLNYLGQGALILEHYQVVDNPFFQLVPPFLLLPLVIIATLATIIASQAVITGAFSLTRQAVLMGFLPHLEVRHTSADQHGQIYMPYVNRWLCIVVVLLCVMFGSSAKLAAAYGIAVTGTMIVTTLIATYVIWKVLQKGWLLALLFLSVFLTIDLVFFSANVLKIFDGGFAPIIIAAFIYSCMMIWMNATRYIHLKASRSSVSLSDLMEELEREPPTMVDGTAIYLASNPSIAPLSMLQNLKHNKVLHSRNVVVNVVTSVFPVVLEAQRISIDRLSSSVTRVYIHYGFMETPDVPQALHHARAMGLDIDLKNASYFISHRSVVGHPARGLPAWQEAIYVGLTKIATTPTDFFRLPSSRVIEIGVQVFI